MRETTRSSIRPSCRAVTDHLIFRCLSDGLYRSRITTFLVVLGTSHRCNMLSYMVRSDALHESPSRS